MGQVEREMRDINEMSKYLSTNVLEVRGEIGYYISIIVKPKLKHNFSHDH